MILTCIHAWVAKWTFFKNTYMYRSCIVLYVYILVLAYNVLHNNYYYDDISIAYSSYMYCAVWGHALHKHSHMFKVFVCVPKYTSAAISVLSVLVQRVCSTSVHDSFDLKDVHSHWYTDTLFLIPVNAHTHTHTRTHARTHTHSHLYVLIPVLNAHTHTRTHMHSRLYARK